MILRMYSIFDAAIGAYTPPFAARADGEAVRSFKSTLLDPNHPMAKFPEHYSVVRVGLYDDATGQMSPLPAPEVLATAQALIATASLTDRLSQTEE